MAGMNHEVQFIRVDDQGNLVIQREVAEKLGLSPRVLLAATVREGHVVLSPIREATAEEFFNDPDWEYEGPENADTPDPEGNHEPEA